MSLPLPPALPTESASSPSDEALSMRTLFGAPSMAAAPVFDGSAADRVVADPRIAIIDDEPINIKVVQKYLSVAGYKQFFTTTDSTQAMDLIRREQPDVVLLDIMMPEISGLDILEELRASKELSDLPVVVLTAAVDKETRLAALRRGATEFLEKPVDSIELEVRLRNVLTVKAHQDRLKNHMWELELEVAVRSAEVTHAYERIVECLARVGEYRDNDTGNHVRRVGHYAEVIACRLGLPKEIVARIRQAAPLHDIGKVGIPDTILLKPGRLDKDEFETMREHCDLGMRVFAAEMHESGGPDPAHTAAGAKLLSSDSSPLLEMAATIAYTHHEKWDGNGYPRGLAGEDIPIEGRITAVADVFDALSSQRPYKKALPIEKTLEIMEESRGAHFDPRVLDAFFDEIDEILRVQREYSDRPEPA